MSADARDFVEVASVASGTVLIALSNGNFIVSHGSPIAACPFLTSVQEPTVSSTRALLMAAMYVWLREQDERGTIAQYVLTLPRVILGLISCYHTTHVTPGLLRVAADRFRTMGRSPIAEFLEKKIREESGHDQLALNDLRDLGLPAARLVENIKPSMAAELVSYFEAAARADNPMAVVGYAYALERYSLFIGTAHIDAVQALCSQGVEATRCLRVHSATGADVSHVAEMVEFIASLPKDDRLAVLRAVYDTTRIIAAPRREDGMTDGEIDGAILKAAGRAAGPEPALST